MMEFARQLWSDEDDGGDFCPACGEWRYVFVQCVPGDRNSEYVCPLCAMEWRETHRWDDAEGAWVDL